MPINMLGPQQRLCDIDGANPGAVAIHGDCVCGSLPAQ
jgi:hypothetical protein